ncbi:MAG TPA: hypothetical protein VFC18_05645 [Burkholderiales bacterium]|nr:hypothetical protein [Burkholderiales bacterium]
MKRTLATILALAFTGGLLAACDNAGQTGAGSTADPDRTKRTTPGAPASPGGAGSGSTSRGTTK